MSEKIITGPQFRKAREGLRLSQTQLAELMRLPSPEVTGYRTISRWEHGRPPGPALAHLEALVDGWRPTWWKKNEREAHFHDGN